MSQTLLLIRLGAMGDVLHALPAAASLKQSFPNKQLVWVIKPRWMPLLQGNPYVDAVLPFERNSLPLVFKSWRALRSYRPESAFDLQGLIQSALIARFSGARNVWGYEREFLREPAAAVVYTDRVSAPGPHRIEKALQLVKAAGASILTDQSWLPKGAPEGKLPEGKFVLANPFAGWASKQWPLEHYRELAALLRKEGLILVCNIAEGQRHLLPNSDDWWIYCSSLSGLIDATRRATAVVGVDSGPLHLAAALRRPGAAIFGPTDPDANGPYGGSFTVLRQAGADTTYKRGAVIAESMRAISSQMVFEALMDRLQSSASFETAATRS
jgi:heptosyltransferase I